MDRSLQRRLQKTNYQHIKRLCRDRGQLFEDVDFQPVARSLYKNKKPGFHPIVWLRPHVSFLLPFNEVTNCLKFYEGISRVKLQICLSDSLVFRKYVNAQNS